MLSDGCSVGGCKNHISYIPSSVMRCMYGVLRSSAKVRVEETSKLGKRAGV